MDYTYLIVILALATLLADLVFSMVSKAKIEKRMDDPDAPKSTLAAGKISTGKPADL
jgi:hypothetical protein